MGHATDNDGVWTTSDFTLTPPYTIQYQVYNNSSASGNSIFTIAPTATKCDGSLLEIANNWSTTQLSFGAPWSTTSGKWHWTIANTAWSHNVLRYSGAATTTKPTVWVNGANVTVTTDTTPSGTASSITGSLNIGSCYRSENFIWDGKISRIAVWNVELTDSEVTSLYNGVSPLNTRYDSLVFYAPLQLYQDNQVDWSQNKASISISGTAVSSNDARQSF